MNERHCILWRFNDFVLLIRQFLCDRLKKYGDLVGVVGLFDTYERADSCSRS